MRKRNEMAVALILTAVASFVAPPSNAAMHGLGFNSLADWPADSITHVRVWDSGAAWCQIHSGVDSYDWTALDAEVAQAEAMYPGVSILYTIGGCPLWLAKYPDNPNYAAWLGPGSNSMPSDIDEFIKQVKLTASSAPCFPDGVFCGVSALGVGGWHAN